MPAKTEGLTHDRRATYQPWRRQRTYQARAVPGLRQAHCPPVRRQVDRDDGTRHRCHRPALRGSTVCGGRGSHGGSARQVRAAAARREAESVALAAYERYSPNGDRPVDLLAALEATAAEVRRWTDWTGRRVEELTRGDWRPDEPRAAAELAMYERALKLSSRFLADLARIGVEARLQQRMAELEAEHAARVERFERNAGLGLARIMKAALGDFERVLCPVCVGALRAAIPEVMPRRIRELGP
jgi:hypothetical protein